MRVNYCAECGVSLSSAAPVAGDGRPASRHQRWCSEWELPATAVAPCGMCHGRKRLPDDNGTMECPRCDGSGEEPGARSALTDAAMLEGIRRKLAAA